VKPHGFRHKLKLFIFVPLLLVCLFMFSARLTHAVANQKPVQPMYSQKQTVCIDPGHGGVDPGALSTDGSMSERDINLTVALKVKSILNTDGYQVFMTRTTNDVSMDNHARYTYCNTHQASVMISIHHNFFTDESVDYSSDLFYKTIDQGLANSIVIATSTKLGIANNGIAQFEDGVLSESTMPAAVSEGFFITSSDEFGLLGTAHSTRLSDEAAGIAAGITTYLSDPVKATAAVDSNVQVLDRASD
jgi:N-acetylmuramoyl-L-alanine amidase